MLRSRREACAPFPELIFSSSRKMSRATAVHCMCGLKRGVFEQISLGLYAFAPSAFILRGAQQLLLPQLLLLLCHGVGSDI